MLNNVHNWVFTYESFLTLLMDGYIANLLPYQLECTWPTPENSVEFAIILKKNRAILEDATMRNAKIEAIVSILEKMKLETALSSRQPEPSARQVLLEHAFKNSRWIKLGRKLGFLKGVKVD